MHMPDGDLLVSTAAGDPVALRALYQRYGKAVFSWSAQVLGSAERAADATERLFAAAVREASSWDGQTPVGAWLYALARSTVGETAPDPDLYAVWVGGQAAAFIDAMPMHQGEALRLVGHERRSVPEAARILGMTEIDTRRAVFDGLVALREALEHMRRPER